MRDGLVETDYLGRYIVGSGEKHRLHKEMNAKQIENQRPVVNLVSPVAQATEMTRSEVKREREMAKSKTFIPPGQRKKFTRLLLTPRFHYMNSVDIPLYIEEERHPALGRDATFPWSRALTHLPR